MSTRDACTGVNALHDPARQPGPIIQAACWAYARRKVFESVASKARGEGTIILAPVA